LTVPREQGGGAAVTRIALPARLSPTAIGRYRVCPKSFFLTDIERIPRSNEASPILAQGNAVHHALERFFGLPATDRHPDNLERALRSVWHEHRKPGSFTNREEEASFGQAAVKMLRDYGERFDLSAEPLAREQWVSLQLAGVRLYGKIDRVDRTATGGLDLIDYKSGRRLIEPDDIAQEPAVQVYVLAAEEKFNLLVERVRFIFLALQQEVAWEPEREDIEELRERLVRTLADLRADEIFEARPGDHCRFCPAALRCTDRQRVTLDELVPVDALPF
jgi:putative RecB family exonuclease